MEALEAPARDVLMTTTGACILKSFDLSTQSVLVLLENVFEAVNLLCGAGIQG